MWDRDLKAIFLGSLDESVETINANLLIYESISDDYRIHTRIDPRLPPKLCNAARRAVLNCPTPSLHLDFACGPGNVIGWLKTFDMRQIGVDISLTNLRNARKHTGCEVVCGSACSLPFANGAFDLVTESSALHHIPNWKLAVSEAIRVAKYGVVLDSEPTKQQMSISKLAEIVFEARFLVYHLLSYFMRSRYMFSNLEEAKLNAKAEIHHQPGTGFPLDELEELFKAAGFVSDIVLSPSPDLIPDPTPNWKQIILSILSLRHPWAPEYGTFTAIGRRIELTHWNPS